MERSGCGRRNRGAAQFVNGSMASMLLFLHEAPHRAAVRIRIMQKPIVTSTNGRQIDRFEPGPVYDVEELLGPRDSPRKPGRGPRAVQTGDRDPVQSDRQDGARAVRDQG